jgi:hypothetical protein
VERCQPDIPILIAAKAKNAKTGGLGNASEGRWLTTCAGQCVADHCDFRASRS